MPYPAKKTRVTFQELCARLDRHGFSICQLSHYRVGEVLHLRLVVMNRSNLAVQAAGPVAPPPLGGGVVLPGGVPGG